MSTTSDMFEHLYYRPSISELLFTPSSSSDNNEYSSIPDPTLDTTTPIILYSLTIRKRAGGAERSTMLVHNVFEHAQEHFVIRLDPKSFRQTIGPKPVRLLDDDDHDVEGPDLSLTVMKDIMEKMELESAANTAEMVQQMCKDEMNAEREMRTVYLGVLSIREVNSDPIIAQHDVYSNSPFKRTGNKVLPCEILKQGDPRAESFKGMIRARINACLE